jgi:hypothetical protein
MGGSRSNSHIKVVLVGITVKISIGEGVLLGEKEGVGPGVGIGVVIILGVEIGVLTEVGVGVLWVCVGN